MKRCSRCRKIKLKKRFYARRQTGEPLSQCISCCKEQSVVSTSQRRRLKIERVNELKAVPCADCGEEYPPYVMDFDHLDEDKIEGVSCMVRRNRSWAAIEAEIAKCEVVCANCHRERTHNRTVVMA